jgi:hypothetical protein
MRSGIATPASDEHMYGRLFPRLRSCVPESRPLQVRNACIEEAKVDEVLWRVDQLAREQHSIVSWDQIVRAGATPSWIYRREHEGYLTRVGPGAYRTWGVRRAFENRAMAAVLSARVPAYVSHRAAAWLHELEGVGMPGFIDITVPRHRRPRRRAGITFHESTDLDLLRPTVRNRIPVTGVARTILECCSVVDDPIRLLDSALYQRLVTWEELWECLLLHSVRGRRGLGRYRAILLERDTASPPQGEFARRMGRLLVAAGVPAPRYEHEVEVDGRKYRLDLAWPERPAAVECNGDGAHGTPRNFQRDPARRNRLELAGWRVLEYTWWQMVNEPGVVVAEVRQAVCG